MKLLAIFSLLGMLVTARVAAHDDIGPARVQTAALTATVTADQATDRSALPDALSAGGISITGQCEELRNICTVGCLEFIGNARGACLRACTRDYNDCISHGG